MKKYYLFILFLLGCQLAFAAPPNFILKLSWPSPNSHLNILNETVCQNKNIELKFEWNPLGSIQKAPNTNSKQDFDLITIKILKFNTTTSVWDPIKTKVYQTIDNNADFAQTGSIQVATGSINNQQKFKVQVIKKHFLKTEKSDKLLEVFLNKTSSEYILNTTYPTPSLSSSLKAGSQTFTSNSTFSASNVVCDEDLILTNVNSTHADKVKIVLEKFNNSGQSLGVANTTGIVAASILSSTINLNTLFSIQKDHLYKVSIQVRNQCGIWNSPNNNVFFINYNRTKKTIISSSPSSEICIGSSVTVTLSDPPNNFQWTSTSGTLPTGINSTITPTQTGVYNITSNDHCINLPNNYQIIVNPSPTIDLSNNQTDHCVQNQNPIQLTAVTNPISGTGVWTINNGSISQGGIFDPSQNFMPQNFIATYTFTDINGCTNTADFPFGYHQESTFSTTINNLTCHNSNDGGIFTAATGFPPYSYTLNNISQAPGFTGLSAGVYQVKLTDKHNCISTQHVTVTQPQPITASLNLPTTHTVSCYGAGVYVQVNNVQGGTGTYLYDFGNGFSSNSGQLLYPQSNPYQIQIKDQNGCIKTLPFQLNGPLVPISTNPTSTAPLCSGQPTGNISLSVHNYTAPIVITWNNGMTGSSISNLAAGTYTYNVTDANGCVVTGSINLTNQNTSSGINVQETITHSSCQGVNDGAISLTPSGSYSYAWSTGANSTNISNLVHGNYHVVITNNTSPSPLNGCKITKYYGVNNNGSSSWHKNTLNNNGQTDKVIKVITDAQNNVYSLGEIIGSSEIDGQQIQTSNNGNVQKGLFVSKHDACGQLRWIDYTNSTTTIDIKGLEIAFDGSQHLRVFGQLENQGAVNFDIKSTNGSNLTFTPNNNNDVFSARIRRGTGDLSNPQNYEIIHTDKVNGIAIDNNIHYFAGQFNGSAQVIKQDINNPSSPLPIVFGENGSSNNNEISSIVVNNSGIYATANLSSTATFNGTTIPSNGKEGVLFHYNNGSLSSNLAGAENIILNDVLLTSNNQIWVAGTLEGPTNWGSNLVAKYKTAILCEFNSNLVNNNTFFIDDKNSVFTEAAAIALSERNGQLYAAGTYTGQTIGMKRVAVPNNLVQATGGLSNHSAMWLASLDITSTTPSINWINNSFSNQPINVYDVATDGFNSYVVGSYKDNIQLPPSSSLANPTNGSLELGYIIRGGAAYGQPVFYKTATTTRNPAYATTTAQLTDKTIETTSNKPQYEQLLKTDKINQLPTSSLKLFPNPNNSRFTIQLETIEKGRVKLMITDLSGRTFHQQTEEITNTVTTLEITPKTLSKGIYILHMELNGKQQHRKFSVH